MSKDNGLRDWEAAKQAVEGEARAMAKQQEEFIRKKRIEELRAMAGTIDLVDNWYELRHMEHQQRKGGSDAR